MYKATKVILPFLLYPYAKPTNKAAYLENCGIIKLLHPVYIQGIDLFIIEATAWNMTVYTVASTMFKCYFQPVPAAGKAKWQVLNPHNNLLPMTEQ